MIWAVLFAVVASLIAGMAAANAQHKADAALLKCEFLRSEVVRLESLITQPNSGGSGGGYRPYLTRQEDDHGHR